MICVPRGRSQAGGRGLSGERGRRGLLRLHGQENARQGRGREGRRRDGNRGRNGQAERPQGGRRLKGGTTEGQRCGDRGHWLALSTGGATVADHVPLLQVHMSNHWPEVLLWLVAKHGKEILPAANGIKDPVTGSVGGADIIAPAELPRSDSRFFPPPLVSFSRCKRMQGSELLTRFPMIP